MAEEAPDARSVTVWQIALQECLEPCTCVQRQQTVSVLVVEAREILARVRLEEHTCLSDAQLALRSSIDPGRGRQAAARYKRRTPPGAKLAR